MRTMLVVAAAVAAAAPPYALSQSACSAVTGEVKDATSAVLPGALLSMDGGAAIRADKAGRFTLPCVAAGKHEVEATAEGFAARKVSFSAPRNALEIVLKPQSVNVEMEVNADDAPAQNATSTGASQTISGSQLQGLADDPDDLLRELQQFAGAAGGNPANATIAVDGFQDSSKLPPKSTIAYIKVNPDQFSAEYREPPFEGGRIEVYTKPGQSAYHGALFLTNGSPWMNARDPFSTSKASLGKQRYGFELTGPVTKKNSDFAAALEYRRIDNFGVVNATTLDANGNPVSTITNVPAPQRLWIGSAKTDWQLGAKNTLIVSYNANVGSLRNKGVGGYVLPEGGYDSSPYEHILRFSNVTTVSAKVMHESKLSLRWDGDTDTPASTAPQVQVAGAFTGGGNTIGLQRLREFNVEWDDDAIIVTSKHTVKFGTQLMTYRERKQLTTNFNGTYTFGGGSAPVLDSSGHAVPGQTTTITGLEQYHRSQLRLPGGMPTAYSDVEGTPQVNFTTVMNALYVQDDWNVGHGLHISSGVRWFMQNNPKILNSATPRFGVMWSPTKNNAWTLHAHVGMFSGRFGQRTTGELLRQDGVHRITSTIYNPVYGDPFAGATPIYSRREYAPKLGNLTWAATNVGGTRSFAGGFNLSLDYYIGRIWNYTRSNNINAPLNNTPTGPRPGPANTNILQMQASGQGRVNVVFAGLEQHKLKRAQFFFGGARINLVDNTDDDEFFTPQNSRSDAGEYARRSGQGVWNIFGNATFVLPVGLNLSGNFNGQGGQHYNILTGFDNNGDGNFNDRPQYATPGQAGAIQTRYGALVASGGQGVFPRNMGVMPWVYYLDTNLQRTFALHPKAKDSQTLVFNVRSSNVLNHMNVKSMGGVLGSPAFGQAVSADNGRRVELGVRYSF